MNHQGTKALKVKLLKFCGFKEVRENWWENPAHKGMKNFVDDSWCIPYHAMPDLVNSLDDQAKYLIPKILSLKFYISKFIKNEECHVYIYQEGSGFSKSSGFDKKESIAYALAVERLISMTRGKDED